jgi:hypothetical protein
MEFRLSQEDEREFSLAITEIDVEGGPDHLTLPLEQWEAIDLFQAVDEGIGDYVREMRREKARFEASRGRMLDELFDPDCGYSLGDPKHPTYHERMAEAWDNRDKTP